MNKLPVKEFVCDLETGGTDPKTSEILSCAVDLFLDDKKYDISITRQLQKLAEKITDMGFEQYLFQKGREK